MSIKVNETEIACFYKIENILSEEPLNQEKLDRAIQIFNRTHWTKKKLSNSPLGCSYETYMNCMTDYREEAEKVIRQAKQVLYKKESPTSTLQFFKEPILPKS